MSNTDLTSVEAQASYGIGMQMGKQLKDTFNGVDVNAAVTGILDAFKNQPARVSQHELSHAFETIQTRLAAEEAERTAHVAAEGLSFLEANAKRDGVIVTPTGLQYEIIKQGDGITPSANCTVRTHYRGTLINGTEFDSSYSRGEPIEFPVNGVIAGWTEALQKMTVGSTWKLYIPHQLAYGERGAGQAIGPYQTLIFDIELLGVV